MAQVVKLKRSSTAGNVPTSGQMVAGELAMNTADGKLFLRDDSDVRPIVTVDNEVTGSINLIGNITASIISASGDITSNDVYINEWGSVSASLATRVDTFGAPANNYVAVFTDSNTIEGTNNLTWNGSTLLVDGSTGIQASSISNRHNDGRLGINAAGEWGYGADIWYHGAISSVTAGKVYYLNSSDGWTVAASGSSTAATGLLGVAPSTGNTSGGLVLRGFVYMANNPGGSTGDKIYLADNGQITATLPSISTHFVRILGYRTAQTGVIYFNPSPDYIQLA